MGLAFKAGTAALAAVSSFAALASAQGFYFDEEMPSLCPEEYNYKYLGCYEATGTTFPWLPSNQDLQGDLSRSYIHWVTSTTWNMTITPNFCADICRAHGHKYAALKDNECSCGSSLDYKNKAGDSVTLRDKKKDDIECETNSVCPGDRLEACGTGNRARIFVDPSFEDDAAEEDLATLAAGYEQLGCFKDPNFPTSQDTITSPDTTFDSTAECFTYCADLGKPLVLMNADAGGAGKWVAIIT